MDNLITSCFNCNRGKAGNSLEITPQSLSDKAKEIKERELQIAGYNEILQAKADRIYLQAWEIVHALFPLNDGIRKDWFQSIKKFVELLPFPEVMDAAEISAAKRLYSDKKVFLYFCGICWRKLKEYQDGAR